MKNILVNEDPFLRKTLSEVSSVEKRHLELANEMLETMTESEGIGLAANQIGSEERMFIALFKSEDEKGNEKYTPRVFINPVISEPSDNIIAYEEGCLSIPKFFADVDRPDSCTITFLDLDGEEYSERLDGINARIAQHELDHLNGVLFTDYLK